jgi:hypothetical protein
MTIARTPGPALALGAAPALILALSLMAACSDDGNGAPDAMVSPACLEANDHSDLAWLQDNVFTPSCAAFSVCHQGNATSAQGLNLEAGNTEFNLVNVASGRFPDQTLVVPGDPQASYLMAVLGSYPGTLSDSGTMPPNNPVLCDQKRQAVERWIASLPAN